MLGDGEDAPGKGDVVIGGEKSDQAEGKATDGLGESKPVETGPGTGSWLALMRSGGHFGLGSFGALASHAREAHFRPTDSSQALLVVSRGLAHTISSP